MLARGRARDTPQGRHAVPASEAPVPETEPSHTSTVAPGAVTGILRQLAEAPSRPLPVRLPALPAGVLVAGRFELVREIGRGGFGVVYEARDRELRRPVAFKALQLGSRVVREERLLREAEAAAQLAHPNIVMLHDVGRSEFGPFLVLELLQGQTLASRVRQGPLPLREALRIAVEVSRGLAHAHGRGVVHRDLTPGNVFLCDDGQVKVLDFGMAHGFGHRKLDGGTRPYMAPEQRRGAPEDERTDVFALGVIVHQMLSGELPSPGPPERSDARAARLEVTGQPDVGALLARMLDRDPVERPRDGEEVAAALTALWAGLDPEPAGNMVRLRRRRPVPLRALAATALALLGASGTAWLQGHPGGDPATAGGGVQGFVVATAERQPVPAAAAPRPEPEAIRASRAPLAGPGAPTRRGRVAFCRDSIDAVRTPAEASGDGVLTLEAEPFGEVFLNDQPYGDTPVECRVTAGTYRVRAVHPQRGEREARVQVGPGRRARWMADFLEPLEPR